ncbi:MAG TPA: CPBP family intramembrane glutamic endopeptidase [Thermoguttaceae bacterium]|nr:CPBP family intramembrane glutamic endopeptidase [Thermoguttaceae bacterium]
MMDEEIQPPRNFALVAAIFEGGLAVVAVGLGALLGLDPLQSFPQTLSAGAWGVGWGLAATLPALAAVWLCIKCPLRPFVELVRVVDEMLLPLFRDFRLVEMAVISLLAGLGEELLFRGILQQALADWIQGDLGVGVGLGVAAILFGLLHRITLTYAVLATLIGLYLGFLWIVSDYNLLVPITAHAAYDFLVLVYMVRIRKTARRAQQTDPGDTGHGEDDQRPTD